MAAGRLVFFLFLLYLAGSHAASGASVVEETCARATAGGEHEDLAPFCVAVLEAAPGSAGAADARGLAVIATNLTLANYTGAVATIKSLLRRGGWPEGTLAALGACRQRYLEAQNVVHSAIHALNAGDKSEYAADMRVVRKAPTDCEDAFRRGGGGGGPGNAAAAAADDGEESPLRKVNEDAVKLTTVCMLIVQAL